MIQRYAHRVRKGLLISVSKVKTNAPHDPEGHFKKPVSIEWPTNGLMFYGHVFGREMYFNMIMLFFRSQFPVCIVLFPFTYISLFFFFFNFPIGGLKER